MASGQRLFLLTIVALKTLGLVIENTFTTPNNGKLNLFEVADFLQYVVDINQYGLDLSGITTLTFEAKACRDANTIMSNSDNGNSSKPIYEFIIGGWENQKSAILRRNDDSLTKSSQQVVIFNTPDICKCDEYRQFWISANNGVLMMGKGLIVGINVIAEWTDPDPFTVKSIGIITWGGIGEWKVQLEGNIVSFS
ncbi:C3 and PZP-like alpha-2-macroglobulin domain-containing protein 8 [Mytilus edulis]|uniref:C3 and PZP-like alpha-2-macroglobulin domain-containing protein 8 n=1 Tax=Mytilus edulis TaxID=6550 RepID=UPI0039F0155E